MAKIVITIEDKKDNDRDLVAISIDSDPPFNMEDESQHTSAQLTAITAAQAMQQFLEDEDEIDVPDVEDLNNEDETTPKEKESL